MGKRLVILMFVAAALCITTVGVWAGPQYIEDSIHVPKDTSANVYTVNVFPANDHGCNDYWAQFNSGAGTLPRGVWADNFWNQLHIDAHSGLDGYFICWPTSCVTYLCTKHGGLYDASTVKVRY